MIIDEPRPHCQCGKPLKRSTYFRSFRNLLPNGKEYPTTIAECQSLVEPGHHIMRFQYARDVVWDRRGNIVDYGPDLYIYGANVWKGTYGNFGYCGKCLPYHQTTKFAETLKLLEAPADLSSEVQVNRFWKILVVVVERASAVRSRFRRSGAPAPIETDLAPHLRLPDSSSESVPGSSPFPTSVAETKFLEVPVFEATDAEIVLMWRSFAHQRNEYASMLDKDPTNPHARERYDMLKGCMLKMRAQAEARRVSVDFSPPEIIKFSGLEWHDLEPEDEPGFIGFEPSREGVEPGRDEF